jgi:tRNA(fMet)-specific endonuclease VapC
MIAPQVLVDTSAVVEFFKGDPEIGRMLEQHKPVFVPVVVVAELLLGALRSQKVQANIRQIEAFVQRNRLLPCDADTALHYADIANRLRARGRPIPQNDMWIAAVARQYGLSIAARDGHFDEVDSIRRIPC